MKPRTSYIPKDWLRERVITAQEGGRFARRQALIDLADALLPALRRMAIYHQRGSWLSAYSWDMAEDAASHAYMTFLRKLGTFQEPYDLLAWFNTVIRNSLWTEGQKYVRVIPTDAPFVLDGEAHDRTGVLSVARQVREAVNQLPFEQRVAIYLYYWQELTQSEIAEQSGVTRQAVFGQLNRATKALRKILLGKGFVRDGWADTSTG